MSGHIKRILCLALSLCLCLALGAFAPCASAESEIGKLLVTAVPTPVALMDVGSIAAATSTEGCYIASYAWYDASGNALSGAFGTGQYTVVIRVDAADGYYFSEGVRVYLNNSEAAFTLDSSLKSVTLSRSYVPDVWAPSIIKHPGSETVNEGELASFVSTATYVASYGWELQSPDGSTVYDCLDAPDKFPGLSVSDPNSDKIILYNIPAALDGWKIRCVFHSAADGLNSYSNYASITVTPAETAAPAVADAAEASPTAAPAASLSPTPAATAKPTSTPTPTAEATETPAAQSPSAAPTAAASAEPTADAGSGSIAGMVTARGLLWIIVAVFVLCVVIMIADAARNNRRRRRRRR